MDSFLKLPAAERKLVFEETAKRYDVRNFVVIEKDFLGVLDTQADFRAYATGAAHYFQRRHFSIKGLPDY